MSFAFRLIPKIAVAMAAALGMFFQINITYAATPPSSFQIITDSEVIYCTAGPVTMTAKEKQALSEGTPITFSWEIIMKEVNTYWINNTVGSITFIRQAIPDLISKTWLLTDSSSGISRRVRSIDEAILWLSYLDHFPTLDRSLLTAGSTYNFHIKIHIHEGEYRDSWWTDLIRFETTVGQKEIILP